MGKSLIKAHGSLLPRELQPNHIFTMFREWQHHYAPTTLYWRRQALKRLITWLEMYCKAALGLHECIPSMNVPAVREISATNEERSTLLAAAPLPMKIFLLLCADLGLRHHTATTITKNHWNKEHNTITFRTKNNRWQTLPLTPELVTIFKFIPDWTPGDLPVIDAFRNRVYQQPKGKQSRYPWAMWKKLKKQTGVRKELHIHDLRRSAAESMWHQTKNIRKVQALLGHAVVSSTARYLANTMTADDLRADIIEATNRKDKTREITDPEPPQPQPKAEPGTTQ